LGVAISGSVFASIFSVRIASASSLAILPADLHSAAGRSMALAHSVIGHIPPALIPAVRAAVNAAFLDGYRVATLVCAAIAVGAALVVAWLLPARADRTIGADETAEPAKVAS
jgi:hypothetical protein